MYDDTESDAVQLELVTSAVTKARRELDEATALAQAYSKIAGRYPIEWLEHDQVEAFEEDVDCPAGVPAAYVVQRRRRRDDGLGMERAARHIATRQDEAVRWALADAGLEDGSS